MTRAELLAYSVRATMLPGELRALKEQLEEFTGDDDCGGQTLSSPPCGGCSRCCAQQACYYASEEVKHRYMRAALGLLIATPPMLAEVYKVVGYGHPSTPIWEKPR
jgi:hypothetical protein